MKVNNAVEFHCPDCEVEVLLKYVARDEDFQVYIIGVCGTCEGTIKISIDNVLEHLMRSGLGSPN